MRNQLWDELKPADTPGLGQAPWYSQEGHMDGLDAEVKDPTSTRKKVRDMAYSLADQGEEWQDKKVPKLNLLGFKAPGESIAPKEATRALPADLRKPLEQA
jgi:hypothetical protein